MSLLDITTEKKTIAIGAVSVTVQGVSIETIASLMRRFPVLRSLLSGEEVDVSSIIGFGGQIVGAVIAAGVGHPDDEAYEKKGAELPLIVQIDLITAIIDATMPGGVRPLAEKITALSSAFGVSSVDPNDLSAAGSPLNSHAALSN